MEAIDEDGGGCAAGISELVVDDHDLPRKKTPAINEEFNRRFAYTRKEKGESGFTFLRGTKARSPTKLTTNRNPVIQPIPGSL